MHLQKKGENDDIRHHYRAKWYVTSKEGPSSTSKYSFCWGYKNFRCSAKTCTLRRSISNLVSVKPPEATSYYCTFWWADRLRIYVFWRLNGPEKLLQISQYMPRPQTFNANKIQELLYILHNPSTQQRTFQRANGSFWKVIPQNTRICDWSIKTLITTKTQCIYK